MKPKYVGEEEDEFFQFGNLFIHLMFFYVEFEVGWTVDNTLAMSSRDDVCRILSDYRYELISCVTLPQLKQLQLLISSS